MCPQFRQFERIRQPAAGIVRCAAVVLAVMVYLGPNALTAIAQDTPPRPSGGNAAEAESPANPPAPAADSDAAATDESPEPAGAEKTDTQAPAGDVLSVKQAQLADRFKRLEEVVGRLAELSASTDPRRARLLREAIAKSREQDINVQFEAIIKLLEDERLSAASNNQTELQKELDDLLTLLLKADRDKELSSQRDRVRQYLKKVSELIRLQKGVRARTEGGDELSELGGAQKRIAGETGKLGGDISNNEGKQQGEAAERADEKTVESANKDAQSSKNESPEDDRGKSSPQDKGDSPQSNSPKDGKPSESDPADSPSKPGDGKSSENEPPGSKGAKPSDAPPPDSNSQGQPGSPGEGGDSGEQQPKPPQDPADRAAERLKSAQQQMDEAVEKLKDAKRKGAADKQREALKDLELAKAELERVLRQLREEEMERTLTQLAARFRKMLELQTTVYEDTVRLDRVSQADRDHDDEIESARLARQEADLVREADKALLLLREEGSSVAFPEAVEQMRDDMRQVSERLAAVKVGSITQGLEQDIIAALEETIQALEKAMKDLEKNRTPPGQAPMAGQPPEPPLVDKLAELRMIRSLQMRINVRTQRYGKMIEGEQAETPDLITALQDLAEKQQRVYRATADLQQGRND